MNQDPVRRSRRKEKGRLGQTASVSRLLEDFIERSGISQEVGLALCQKHWADACGTDLARRSRPIRLDGSILVVAVQDSICFQELTMGKKDILSSLAEHVHLGTKPSDLHLVVDVPAATRL